MVVNTSFQLIFKKIEFKRDEQRTSYKFIGKEKQQKKRKIKNWNKTNII